MFLEGTICKAEGVEVIFDVQFRSDGGSMNVLQNRLTLCSTICLFENYKTLNFAHAVHVPIVYNYT
jgi:hypothetical protein